MAYDLDWDVSNDTPIDEETANDVMEAWKNFPPLWNIFPSASINNFSAMNLKKVLYERAFFFCLWILRNFVCISPPFAL